MERSYRGMRRRARVHSRIERTLKKDWRGAEEVFLELQQKSEEAWRIEQAEALKGEPNAVS